VAEWRIELLDDRHDYADFECGNSELSAWLKSHASQFRTRNLAQTYVLVQPGQTTAYGYYSLSVSSVSFEETPDTKPWKKLPKRMPVPVALIGKLAVDRRVQGQKLGGVLLADAVKRIAEIADEIGIQSIVVDAIDERAKAFYLRFGCVSAADQSLRLFYSIEAARALVAMIP
jgi:predicted GNAT family N-acyltransferase